MGNVVNSMTVLFGSAKSYWKCIPNSIGKLVGLSNPFLYLLSKDSDIKVYSIDFNRFYYLNVEIYPYVQEVRFSGGAKKYSPYVYPPIFRGGARCRQVYPEGDRCIQGYDRCIFFFQRTKKKSGVSFRCCQVYLKVLRGAGYPLTFSGVSWPKLQLKCMKMARSCNL